MESIQIQGAPNVYVCFNGALEKVKEIVEKEEFQHGLLIHGTKSWEAAKKYVEPLKLQGRMEHYYGECAKQEVQRLVEISTLEGCDYIVGIGGGKIMDIVKAVAHQLQLSYILIPTLASNCAPWTPLSVFYDEEGNFVNYEVFPRNALLVAVEPRIIIDSPQGYLRAGIGDTIAKWYEADVLARNLQERPLSIDIALHAAKLCRDVLIEEGQSAMDALQKKIVTAPFIKVIETIIMAGGMVGGFGERYGRIAGAHSVHNGLTMIAETHHQLHGDKVAYGILVQLALEEDYTEIEELLPYYEKMKLPITLADLGITVNVDEAIKKIAEGTTKEGESIHLMNISTPKQVEKAMKELQRIVTDKNTVNS
ncbi:iron-containing alcohol dehydrogenase family protein [Evansella sp. AB-rgal1]|uniref:iron-containing alcohol dehydrogenase family protein n=1 Tax=Evansella sp. AB-rgal1 TaxID=3242696 RepID=UPI00359CD69A